MVVVESPFASKRAGADSILSYYALDMARWLKIQASSKIYPDE